MTVGRYHEHIEEQGGVCSFRRDLPKKQRPYTYEELELLAADLAAENGNLRVALEALLDMAQRALAKEATCD